MLFIEPISHRFLINFCRRDYGGKLPRNQPCEQPTNFTSSSTDNSDIWSWALLCSISHRLHRDKRFEWRTSLVGVDQWQWPFHSNDGKVWKIASTMIVKMNQKAFNLMGRATIHWIKTTHIHFSLNFMMAALYLIQHTNNRIAMRWRLLFSSVEKLHWSVLR